MADRDLVDAEARARVVRITDTAAIAAVRRGELRGQIVGGRCYGYAVGLREWRARRRRLKGMPS